MRRREFGLALASFVGLAGAGASAQRQTTMPKLAILSPKAPPPAEDSGYTHHNVLTGLTELGYVDRQNILFDFRFANHTLERLPALAAELVAGKPDVIYTFSSGAGRAVAAATSTIPIVLAPVAEETMAALVPNFAQPPGNITGLTLTSREQREKCLQLLKEGAPGITRAWACCSILSTRCGRPIRTCLAERRKLSVSLCFAWRLAAKQNSIRHSRPWQRNALTPCLGSPTAPSSET
jgi:hypothetical protein